jgi:multimeric flavodoxin WrbA
MKVLGFVGSPREDGNTKIMVEEVLNGAREAGAETELFNLNQMDIAPCQACMHCKENEGECGTDDDMQTAYAQIREADAFVLGTPVYMWQMSAQAKLFTDRLYANFKTGFEDKYGQKAVALVFSQGNPDKNLFQEYFYYTQNMFEFLGYNVVGLISSQDNSIPGAVENKKEVLDQARELGMKLTQI